MIDHTGVGVSDFQKSKTFYLEALAPLGYQLIEELPTSMAPQGVARASGCLPCRISG